LYLYTGGVNSFHYAATRPPQWPPNTIGRYRNTDPVLINYLIRTIACCQKHVDEHGSQGRWALLRGLRILLPKEFPNCRRTLLEGVGFRRSDAEPNGPNIQLREIQPFNNPII
jgi:hypothetical protein